MPGTPGLEQRIGGLSKEDGGGNVSYDPKNNERMIELRAQKVAGIAKEIPPLEVNGPERGKLLLIGWGSTLGPILSAVEEARKNGLDVSSAHLRHMNPFPSNIGKVLRSFEKILVPELNSGQLCSLLRAEFLVPAEGLNKLTGQPFHIAEILERIGALLQENSG